MKIGVGADAGKEKSETWKGSFWERKEEKKLKKIVTRGPGHGGQE